MSLPKFSDKAGWSEFLKSPVWTDVTDEELATAFRRFQFLGLESPARILMSELAVRIRAYAKSAARTVEIAQETECICFEALVTRGSNLGHNLCVNTKGMITARARYLAKRRGIERQRRSDISTIHETHIDEYSPNAEANILLMQLLKRIEDPKEQEAYLLVLKGHGVTGENSVASKLGFNENAARGLFARAEAKVWQDSKVKEDL